MALAGYPALAPVPATCHIPAIPAMFLDHLGCSNKYFWPVLGPWRLIFGPPTNIFGPFWDRGDSLLALQQIFLARFGTVATHFWPSNKYFWPVLGPWRLIVGPPTNIFGPFWDRGDSFLALRKSQKALEMGHLSGPAEGQRGSKTSFSKIDCTVCGMLEQGVAAQDLFRAPKSPPRRSKSAVWGPRQLLGAHTHNTLGRACILN